MRDFLGWMSSKIKSYFTLQKKDLKHRCLDHGDLVKVLGALSFIIISKLNNSKKNILVMIIIDSYIWKRNNLRRKKMKKKLLKNK
jgi:hypothetical protein